MFNNFFSENRVVNEITWKNVVMSDRPQTKIWRTSIACWIPKATDSHSWYVILIAFLRQGWLRERVTVLCYTTLPILCDFPRFQLATFRSVPHTNLFNSLFTQSPHCLILVIYRAFHNVLRDSKHL
jgi:hypothetical protein